MKTSIGHLLSEPGAEVNVDFSIDPSELNNEEYNFLQPAKVQGVLTNTGNEVRLQGKIETRIEGACSRCLEPVIQDVSIEFDDTYEYDDLDPDEPILDIEQCAADFLMVSLPVKLLCSPDCPGLCFHCGKPLKEGACDCQDKDGDPRLAALKNLFK
jgi:uncharacterized protein